MKTIKDLIDKKYIEEMLKLIWPYEKLKLNVAELDKLENPPVVKIASFLFKSQLVEHELRSFIEFLDSILEKQTADLPFKKIRSPKSQKKILDAGLGQLKDELDNYESESIEKIKTKISLFKNQRDTFTHKLFSQSDDIRTLSKESAELLTFVTECLDLINNTRNIMLEEFYKLKIDRYAQKKSKQLANEKNR